MSRLLSQLIELPPDYDRPLRNLQNDSRQVQPGDVFCAYQGAGGVHGRQFIPAAIARGAAAVLVEAEGEPWLQEGVPCIPYPQLGAQLGALAARFYDHPSQAMRIAAITGTNGKTSVSHYIAQLLSPPCGLLGTLGYGVYGQLQSGQRTTPDALHLQTLLAQLRDQGVKQAALEASSHGLTQHRLVGAAIDSAVFTNLSRDHLDYHGDMQRYGAAKKTLFTRPGLRSVALNLDDPFHAEIRPLLAPEVNCFSYSLEDSRADLYAQNWRLHGGGASWRLRSPWGEADFHTPLLGHFNISNVLAALAVCLDWGEPLETLAARAAQLRPATGRMELLAQAGHAPVLLDYAHTPDALEQLLRAARPHCKGKLYCVFGCGGDRDQGKRPLMGAVADRLADVIVLTDDNPRHEDPQHILAAIRAGIRAERALRIEPDRAAAIQHALAAAGTEDLVVIAGKGHETYQEIGDERRPFSDREAVQALYSNSSSCQQATQP